MEFDLGDRVFVQTDGSSYVDIRQRNYQGEPSKTGIQMTIKSWHHLLGTNEHSDKTV